MTRYRNIMIKPEQPAPLRNKDNRHTQNEQPSLKPLKVPSQQPANSTKPTTFPQKQSKLPISKVFTVISRIHHAFKLRFQTLFLAIQLYLKYTEAASNPQEQTVDEGYLILVCIYLSMKYEQIYPDRIKHLIPFVKIPDFNIKLYMSYEVIVLSKIDNNLYIKTAKNIMQDLLQGNCKEAYLQAYYLLQISYVEPAIHTNYTTEVVCKSILYIMSPFNSSLRRIKQFKGIPIDEITNCSKLLIQAKNSQMRNDSPIYHKYCHEKFMSVAQKHYVLDSTEK